MKNLLIAILILTSSNLFSIDKNFLSRQINSITQKIPASTKYGIMIYDPLSQDTLYSKNITKPIKPASNTKLFTTAVAFSMLGSQYKISTKLFSDDHNLNDGIIDGNLYIKGYGNALFTEENMDSLILDLQKLGITLVTGNIIGDETYFDSVYYRKDWIIDEYSSVKLPPVSALSINRNKISFRVSADSKGRISYSFSPYSADIKVRNSVSTSKRRGRISVRQVVSDNGYEFVLGGSVRRRSTSTATVDIANPAYFIANVLRQKLIAGGISVYGTPAKGKTPENVLELGNQFITLQYLSNLINKNSDNFLAECLFKILGAVHSNSEGNAFYSAQAVNGFLAENEIETDEIALVDGSGISHFNLITVSSVVSLLEKMYLNPLLFQDYYNSLAIAGVDGTLRGRLIGTRAENNLHGKTGTLRDVIALSGYVKSAEGDDLIVSIIFEYSRGRASFYKNLQDRIIMAIMKN